MAKSRFSEVRIPNLAVGVLLVAVGVFLLIKAGSISDPIIFILISAADILFGGFLAFSGIVPIDGREQAGDPDRREIGGVVHYGDSDVLDAAERSHERYAGAPQEEFIGVNSNADRSYYENMSSDEIFAEERRLRRQAQDAERNADRAVAAARHAVAEARAAEADLDAAKNRAQNLYGHEQQQAFREVARLADIARDKAQQANAAKKRAKAARHAAEIAAEQHSLAMDAAADAMDDDLGDDFSPAPASASSSAPRQNRAYANDGFDDDF